MLKLRKPEGKERRGIKFAVVEVFSGPHFRRNRGGSGQCPTRASAQSPVARTGATQQSGKHVETALCQNSDVALSPFSKERPCLDPLESLCCDSPYLLGQIRCLLLFAFFERINDKFPSFFYASGRRKMMQGVESKLQILFARNLRVFSRLPRNSLH